MLGKREERDDDDYDVPEGAVPSGVVVAEALQSPARAPSPQKKLKV